MENEHWDLIAQFARGNHYKDWIDRAKRIPVRKEKVTAMIRRRGEIEPVIIRFLAKRLSTVVSLKPTATTIL